jgi:hypothetical protein
MSCASLWLILCTQTPGNHFDSRIFGLVFGSVQRIRDQGLEHQYSTPYVPSQNGVVERKNRTLCEMARTMLDEHRTPRRYWAEAVNTACHISNRILLRAFKKKTCYELMHGRAPKVSHFRVFGCKLLTQNVHLAPNTQQAEQAGFTRAESHETCQSIFSWKLTKDKRVRYQSLELAGWYQTVPYLRLGGQMGWHIAMKSYLPINWNHSGTCKKGKVTLPNGWRKHDSDRSLFEQRCTCTRPRPIPMMINIK